MRSEISIRTESYGYDELSRLTSVSYGDGQTQGYAFDAMGKRLTKTDSVTGNDTLTYNAANMLLTRNGAAYTHDANGNTLTGGGRVNTWDGQNRLTQCVFNGTTTNHTYGADGLRRRTTQGANTTDYVVDGQSVVRTLLNGVVDKTYLHGARGPEYERTGAGSPVWYLYDGLGSVLGTVDAAGNLVSTRKYDVYGAVRSSTGPSGSKHKFVGQLGHPSEDETGLVYMRARYYDPVTGRFTSEDPARDGSNWFEYCSTDPVGSVDYDGRFNFKLIQIGLELMGKAFKNFAAAARYQLDVWRSYVNALATSPLDAGLSRYWEARALESAYTLGVNLGAGIENLTLGYQFILKGLME